jgi:nickel-dependent lactate racemase
VPAESLSISYGKGHLPFALPPKACATVIRKNVLPLIKDPALAVRAALDAPISAPPFRELARGRRSACILICDKTRPVPNRLFLWPMIEELLAAGVPKGRICILVATGLHRPNTDEEVAEIVGDPRVLATVRVENHLARDDAGHVDLGPTDTRGTPVKIDRRFVEADLRVATGLVEPHFMAGYSGGRKVVAPGIAHADTIRTFHSARFMADPLARPCNLDGNPLHEEQLQIVRKIGEIYGLNTVIDDQRSLAQVTFGEIIASHAAAVSFVRSMVEIKLPRRFKTIVTSAGGYPLDETYYQTVKGMVTPIDILEPGGTLIIASECSEGFGSAEFRTAQARLVKVGPEAFLAGLLRKSLADIDEWQTQMQLKPTRLGRVQLYTTGLTPDERSITGVESVESLDQAILESTVRAKDDAVAVIPEGPYVVPFRA